MSRSICILITRAPYGTVPAAEAIRHVNGALTEGYEAVAALVDDGVWLARKGQSGDGGFTSLAAALETALHNISGRVPRVLVHRPSLESRGLDPADLVPGVEMVDDAGLNAAVLSTQFLLRF